MSEPKNLKELEDRLHEMGEVLEANEDAAEAGCLQSQGQVIEAQAEIERLEAFRTEREGEEAFLDYFCNPHDQWEAGDFS